jgi:hypothetical protein
MTPTRNLALVSFALLAAASVSACKQPAPSNEANATASENAAPASNESNAASNNTGNSMGGMSNMASNSAG